MQNVQFDMDLMSLSGIQLIINSLFFQFNEVNKAI